MNLINLLEQAVGNEYLSDVEEQIFQLEDEKQANSNAIVSVFPNSYTCNTDL